MSPLSVSDLMVRVLEPSRGEGKTFRKLLSAIVQASQGDNVRFLVSTQVLEKYMWRKAVTICDVYLAKDALQLNFVSHKITFPNGGTLTFMTPQRETRGQLFDTIDDTK